MARAGLELGRRLGAGPPLEVPFPPDLQWYDMVRIVSATLDLYQNEPIAGRGVRLGDLARVLDCAGNDENLMRGVLLLHDDDYVAVKEDNPLKASVVLPLPRTLQLLQD